MTRFGNDLLQELNKLLPDLRRFTVTLAANEDVAEDLLQSSVEDVCAHPATWIKPVLLRQSLISAIRQKWKDEVRRQERHVNHVRSAATAERLPIDGCQIAESNLMVSKARECFSKLPEEQRQVIFLVVVAGNSYEQASRDLHIPVGTLMSRLNRGREAMRLMMGGPDSSKWS